MNQPASQSKKERHDSTSDSNYIAEENLKNISDLYGIEERKLANTPLRGSGKE